MQVHTLNKTSNIKKADLATWSVEFVTGEVEAYVNAIIRMTEAFGPGLPYSGETRVRTVKTYAWFFRNIPESGSGTRRVYRLYLTTEEQVTFCSLLGE